MRLLPTDVQVHICSVDLILHPLIPRCILGRPLERLVDSSDRPATWGTGQDIGSTQHREISTRVRQTEPNGDGGVIFSSYPQACSVQ